MQPSDMVAAPPVQPWSRERVVLTMLVLILTLPSTVLLFGLWFLWVFPLLGVHVSAIVVTPFLGSPQPPGDMKVLKIFVMTGLAIGLAPPVTGLMALILAPFIS